MQHDMQRQRLCELPHGFDRGCLNTPSLWTRPSVTASWSTSPCRKTCWHARSLGGSDLTSALTAGGSVQLQCARVHLVSHNDMGPTLVIAIQPCTHAPLLRHLRDWQTACCVAHLLTRGSLSFAASAQPPRVAKKFHRAQTPLTDHLCVVHTSTFGLLHTIDTHPLHIDTEFF